MNDMRAVVGKCGTGLVRHGVNDTEQSVGECHTCKALCIVHTVTGVHIAVVRRDKVVHDHLDRMNSERIGIIAVCGGNVCFNSMRHSVHTGVSNEFLRHSVRKFGVNNSHIGSDLKVRNGIFDTLVVIGYDRECGNFGSRAGSRRNSAEMSLAAKFGNTEHLAHIFKCKFGILVFYPHRFCGIYRRTAADSNDPVGLEFFHSLCAAHNGFYGRVGFDTFKKLNFHTRFFQIRNDFVKEAEAFHASAACAYNSAFAFKCFKRLQSIFAVIDVSG